jgi:hypothetical protein
MIYIQNDNAPTLSLVMLRGVFIRRFHTCVCVCACVCVKMKCVCLLPVLLTSFTHTHTSLGLHVQKHLEVLLKLHLLYSHTYGILEI